MRRSARLGALCIVGVPHAYVRSQTSALGPVGGLAWTQPDEYAAMERELLVERTQSGLAAARARGRVGGRRRSFTPKQQREAQRLYDLRQMSVEQIAKAIGTSTSTVYRYLAVPGDDGHPT